MFTIQYEAVGGEHRMQTFNGRNRHQLVKHLANFEQPIMAVFEQATVITKAARAELAQLPRQTMSRAAKHFVSSPL